LGMEDASEFMALMNIYNKYPAEELIIHPRVQKDFYKNTPDLQAFARAADISRIPVCYNGDIFSVEDYERFTERFPGTDRVMTVRGVLKGRSPARNLQCGRGGDKEERSRLHDIVNSGDCEEKSGDRTNLYKMKELWTYLAPLFYDSKKYAKKIKKAEQ